MKKLITSFFILLFFLAPPVFAKITPNDPDYGRQWYLGKIRADEAWDKISASPDIVIAVIDSGLDVNHPDLRDNIWHNSNEIPNNGLDDDHNGFIDDVVGWNFVDNNPDPSPRFSPGWTETGLAHGTMVAGIIAARGNNAQGVAGVTWQAKIMALKALNDNGEGKISDVIRALDYAIKNGADIINLSFISLTYNSALEAAVSRAHQAGIIIVAAAGNEQAAGAGYDISKTPIYPACYDGQQGENMVIGVAATDALDQKTSFSSYGFRCVDITAPGISFFNTVPVGSDIFDLNKYYDGYWSGTSMAAPLVTATLALIEEANPELSQREVVNILFASTDNVSRLNPDYLGQLGNGRLNVDRAVSMAKQKLYSHLERFLLMPEKSGETAKLTAANGDWVSDFLTSLSAGASLATGDVNGDGQEEIILAAGAGVAPQIQIYNSAGKLLKQFLAEAQSFRGGLNVAVGDLDNDNQAEIIIAPAASARGQIKIFDFNGHLKSQFMATDKRYWGGLNLAAGDLDADGQTEIVAAYAKGNEPRVKIFSPAGALIKSFLVYETRFRGGVQVAVANLDGRQGHNRLEIIVAPGPGRDPLVKVYNDQGQEENEFLAYKRNWHGGVNVAAGDLNNDGISEIATGAKAGASPHVRAFSAQGALMESFYAYKENFNGGVKLAIIKMNH